MKLKKLECPYCGGNVSIEKNLSSCFCPYCGKQFDVDDEVQRIEIKKSETISYRDEARLKEMEYREKARIRKEEEERLREEEKAQAAKELITKRKKWWITIIVWFVAWLGFFLLAISVKKSSALFVIWGILWIGLFVFPSIYPKNDAEKQAPVKNWFKWFGIIFGVLYCLSFIIAIGASNQNEAGIDSETFEEINTQFVSNVTLDSVGGIKYKIPAEWIRTETDSGAIRYSPDSNNRMYILCMKHNSSYSTFSNQVEDTVKWLNEDAATYDVAYKYAIAGDKEIGIATGTIFQNDLECDLIAYILPSPDSNSKAVFIEIVVTAPGYSDPNTQDEQAVVSSVLF